MTNTGLPESLTLHPASPGHPAEIHAQWNVTGITIRDSRCTGTWALSGKVVRLENGSLLNNYDDYYRGWHR